MGDGNNGWAEWSRYVLKELESLNTKSDSLQKGMHQIRIDIATLKAKAAAWGAVTAVIVSGIIGIGLKAMGS